MKRMKMKLWVFSLLFIVPFASVWAGKTDDEPAQFFLLEGGGGLSLVFTSIKLPEVYSPRTKYTLSPRYHLDIGRLSMGRLNYRLRGIIATYHSKDYKYNGPLNLPKLNNVTNVWVTTFGLENGLRFRLWDLFFLRGGLGIGFFSSKVQFKSLTTSAEATKGGIHTEGNITFEDQMNNLRVGDWSLPLTIGATINLPFLKLGKVGALGSKDYLKNASLQQIGLGLTASLRIRNVADATYKRKRKPRPKRKPQRMPDRPPDQPVPRGAGDFLPDSSFLDTIPDPGGIPDQDASSERGSVMLDDNANRYGVSDPSSDAIRAMRMYYGEGHTRRDPAGAVAIAKSIAGGLSLAKDPVGLFILGKASYDGQGMPQDYKKAFKYFEKAAKKNNYFAQHLLGIMYENGEGTEKDINAALLWFKKAAQAGHVPSQFNTGKIYGSGEGVNRDFSQAAEWYSKAAEQGYGDAQYYLGVLYQEGLGVTKNFVKAAAWFQMAADQGHLEAQVALGGMYEKGHGLQRSMDMAMKWYNQAADLGHIRMQFELGNMYSQGTVIQEDLAKAAEWYKMAAKQNHMESEYTLGVIYEKGIGVEANKEEAIYWYRRAARQGHVEARATLDRIVTDHKAKLDKSFLIGEPPPKETTEMEIERAEEPQPDTHDE